jgi:putative nucleotidyltransferase with HDIG domain
MGQQGHKHRPRGLQPGTLSIFLDAIEVRDPFTARHSERVAHYGHLLAEHLGLTSDDESLLEIGALLHDVGVLGIADPILRKLGPLTTDEWEIMKTHTVIGARILEQAPELAAAIPVVRSHHERWAGDGYPDALKGDEIPYLARIVAVADAFDAMTGDRPYYRDSLPADAAFAELQQKMGTQFDPGIVAAFIRIRERLL